MDEKLVKAQEEFYRIVDHEIALLEQRMPTVVCPPDCSACCLGDIFFVTALDFSYVCHYAAQHLTAEQREAIVKLAAPQAERTGIGLALELETSNRRRAEHEGQPCPFLQEGKCSIYPARPTPCRLYGRTRFGNGRPNLCDTIVEQISRAPEGRAAQYARLPMVEEFSGLLARILQSHLCEEELREVEKLLRVSTLPVFIAQTELDEQRLSQED